MKIPVRCNHVGYATDAAKIFFVNPQEFKSANEGVDSYKFRVARRVQNEDLLMVWEGSLVEGSFEHHGVCEYTGETLWSGDFSGVSQTGIFFIQILKKMLPKKRLWFLKPNLSRFRRNGFTANCSLTSSLFITSVAV
jgi:endoglucanase